MNFVAFDNFRWQKSKRFVIDLNCPFLEFQYICVVFYGVSCYIVKFDTFIRAKPSGHIFTERTVLLEPKFEDRYLMVERSGYFCQ